jgi:hypothetical protein
MKRRRALLGFAVCVAKSVLMKTVLIWRMKMSKIVRWFFTLYEEDDYASYLHNGVGYAGVLHDMDKYARKKHHGIGYGGIYD